ncbi:MAG: tetratricopeptide repeat protein, partial [Spirochaetota bacterium]
MPQVAATLRRSPASAVVLLSFLLLLCLPTVAPAQEDADALALYRQGRYNEAVAVTLQEIEAMPRNMDSYTVLGWSLLALGRYQDALEYGLRALEISRFDVRVIGIVGEAHYNLGNYLQALDYFEEYVAIPPT